MTNMPPPLDPIAQLVAKYQSNGHQTTPTQQQQPALQPQKKKGWTGFTERTLWDWLNLLGVLLVPLVLGAGTILITAQQSALSQSQHESDLSIANTQFQEALLKTFRDDISRLVFDQHLLTAKHNDPVQIMAQSYTNDALRKLDLSRRVLLVRFLSDLHLIVSTSTITKDSALISLVRADLWGADLRYADLRGADLRRADLGGAHLSGAHLGGAKVTPEDLALAYSLQGVILPDGSHYPSRSYPIPNHHDPTQCEICTSWSIK